MTCSLEKNNYNNISLNLFIILFCYWFSLLVFLLSDFIFHHIGYTITADESPLNWFTALNLILASFTSIIIFVELRCSFLNVRRFTFLWVIIAAGLLFAGLDEQFELHEKMGALIDKYIVGRGYELFFYKVFDEGEKMVIMFYAVAGVIMTFIFLFYMVASRKAAICYVAAIIFQVIAMLCDRFNVVHDILGIMSDDVNYTGYIEEISEFTSSILFLSVMLLEYFWLRLIENEDVSVSL